MFFNSYKPNQTKESHFKKFIFAVGAVINPGISVKSVVSLTMMYGALL